MASEVPAIGLLADLRSALDRVTRPPMAGVAAAVILASLLVVVAVHLAGLKSPSSGHIETGTGDFLAFWTGAVALHEGNGASLYDFAAQRDLQVHILGGVSESFQPYLNPPLLALLLSTIVPLGFVPAFYAFVSVCAACLVLGLGALLRVVPTIRHQPGAAWTLVLAIASYQPMLETTFGGQNTPITFALLAALSLALQRRSTLLAALVLGLLTFKPQYAVGAGLALLFAGQWRVISGGAVVGLAHWLIGAWWSGLAWPLDMLAFLRVQRPLELSANAWDHFSAVTVAHATLPTPLDSAVAALAAALVLAAWWRFRELGRSGDPAWLALVICGTMLASPHQQYYDVALLTLPIALLVDRHLAEHRPDAEPASR